MKRLFCLFLAILLLTGCAGKVTPTLPSLSQPSQSFAPSAPTDPPASPTQPDPLEVLLAQMTLEELVGQLFLARCPEDTALEDIEAYHLGGYVLFARDFQGETPDSVTETIGSYQQASNIPMLIAVDEEGGMVTRVSSCQAFRSQPFPAPRMLYAQGGLEAVLEVDREKAALLTALGINVNLAPVCDLSTDPEDFIYSRSLGLDPETTGQVVSQMVTTMDSYGLGSVLKHFPGYGGNADTHTGIAVDHRTLETLEKADLVPFQAAIDNGCDAIMVSHNIVTALDASLPASLSPAVHRYLREEMGFSGVIVTDDLVMDAISDVYGVGEAAVMAVNAGNDLLCSTEFAAQYAAVLEAVKTGEISMDTLQDAVLRILTWKQALGLL